MFGTNLLQQLISEIFGIVVVPVIVVILYGIYLFLCDLAYEFIFRPAFFHYRDIPRFKSLQLDRPIHVVAFYYKKSIAYVRYDCEGENDTFLVRLGSKGKGLEMRDVFSVVRTGWYGRRVQVSK